MYTQHLHFEKVESGKWKVNSKTISLPQILFHFSKDEK